MIVDAEQIPPSRMPTTGISRYWVPPDTTYETAQPSPTTPLRSSQEPPTPTRVTVIGARPPPLPLPNQNRNVSRPPQQPPPQRRRWRTQRRRPHYYHHLRLSGEKIEVRGVQSNCISIIFPSSHFSCLLLQSPHLSSSQCINSSSSPLVLL